MGWPEPPLSIPGAPLWSPSPPQQPPFPRPFTPPVPSELDPSMLNGSPKFDAASVAFGASNSTPTGSGSLGSGLIAGGMKTRCTRGGGAPRRARGMSWLAPPACAAGLPTGSRGGVNTSLKTWAGRGLGGRTNTAELRISSTASAAKCNRTEMICDFGVDTLTDLAIN